MSYQSTTLIAREGYSGLDGMDPVAAASYCGQKFGLTSKDFQPCKDWYVSGKPGDYQAGSGGAGSSSGGTLSQIGGFFGDMLKGAVNSYASAKGGAGGQPVVVSSGPPPWLMPVAIGGIGLVAFLLLRRRRGGGGSAPVQNPARRRRSRRRRARRSRR